MDTQLPNSATPQAPVPEPKKTIKTPVLVAVVGIAFLILSAEAYIFFNQEVLKATIDLFILLILYESRTKTWLLLIDVISD